MTTGEKIRARRRQLRISTDELAHRLGKNRATIYRYESDAIEMPASLLRPLAEALDMEPDELMDWGDLLAGEANRRDQLCQVLPRIADGVSLEGEHQKYLLVKTPAYGGKSEESLRAAFVTLCQMNQAGQGTKLHAARILCELVSALDAKSQEMLVSYGEFLDAQHSKKRGTAIEHPYQRK